MDGWSEKVSAKESGAGAGVGDLGRSKWDGEEQEWWRGCKIERSGGAGTRTETGRQSRSVDVNGSS